MICLRTAAARSQTNSVIRALYLKDSLSASKWCPSTNLSQEAIRPIWLEEDRAFQAFPLARVCSTAGSLAFRGKNRSFSPTHKTACTGTFDHWSPTNKCSKTLINDIAYILNISNFSYRNRLFRESIRRKIWSRWGYPCCRRSRWSARSPWSPWSLVS